ncbi:MAG: hypothetical protein AAF602_28670, partial [Myxococcota bacterium]
MTPRYAFPFLAALGCGAPELRPFDTATDPAAIGQCCTVDAACLETDGPTCLARAGSFAAGVACDETCPLPTRSDLVDRADDLELLLREHLDVYLDAVSTIGREYWNLNEDADPDYTGGLLGRSGEELPATSRFVVDTFVPRYRVVQHAARLIRATEIAESGVLSEQEASALRGYARTLQAYSLLLVANVQFDRGIVPVDALDAPITEASFLDGEDSLQHVADLLDEASIELTDGGPAFPHFLSGAFEGFDQPATFRQLNRALSARVRAYQGDKLGSLAGIAGSFFNINGDQQVGPAHVFGHEFRNPLYRAPDEDLYTVHPDFLFGRDIADLRVGRKTRAY